MDWKDWLGLANLTSGVKRWNAANQKGIECQMGNKRWKESPFLQPSATKSRFCLLFPCGQIGPAYCRNRLLWLSLDFWTGSKSERATLVLVLDPWWGPILGVLNGGVSRILPAGSSAKRRIAGAALPAPHHPGPSRWWVGFLGRWPNGWWYCWYCGWKKSCTSWFLCGRQSYHSKLFLGSSIKASQFEWGPLVSPPWKNRLQPRFWDHGFHWAHAAHRLHLAKWWKASPAHRPNGQVQWVCVKLPVGYPQIHSWITSFSHISVHFPWSNAIKVKFPRYFPHPDLSWSFPCLSFTEISIVNDQFLRLIHFTSNVWASPCSDGKMIGQWWDNMGLCGKNIAHQFTANPTKLCAYWSSTFWSWFLPCFHGGNFFSNFKIPGTVSPFLSSTASETLQRSSLFSVLLVSNLRPSPRRAIRNQLQEANWSGWWF